MTPPQKIFIVDEDGFSRICSAMLNDEGYQTQLAISKEETIESISKDGTVLVIVSYPYGLWLLETPVAKDIPTIILSDDINSELIEIMKGFKHSVCMVKPLDFQRFKYLVRGIVNGDLNLIGRNIIA